MNEQYGLVPVGGVEKRPVGLCRCAVDEGIAGNDGADDAGKFDGAVEFFHRRVHVGQRQRRIGGEAAPPVSPQISET
jgi:hypothetical protein